MAASGVSAGDGAISSHTRAVRLWIMRCVNAGGVVGRDAGGSGKVRMFSMRR